MSEERTELAAAMTAIRRQIGLERDDLARLADIDRTLLWRWEVKGTPPQKHTLERWFKALPAALQDPEAAAVRSYAEDIGLSLEKLRTELESTGPEPSKPEGNLSLNSLITGRVTLEKVKAALPALHLAEHSGIALQVMEFCKSKIGEVKQSRIQGEWGASEAEFNETLAWLYFEVAWAGLEGLSSDEYGYSVSAALESLKYVETLPSAASHELRAVGGLHLGNAARVLIDEGAGPDSKLLRRIIDYYNDHASKEVHDASLEALTTALDADNPWIRCWAGSVLFKRYLSLGRPGDAYRQMVATAEELRGVTALEKPLLEAMVFEGGARIAIKLGQQREHVEWLLARALDASTLSVNRDQVGITQAQMHLAQPAKTSRDEGALQLERMIDSASDKHQRGKAVSLALASGIPRLEAFARRAQGSRSRIRGGHRR